MERIEIQIMPAIIITCFVAVLIVLAIILDIKNKKIVLEKSQRIKTLLALNPSFQFKKIKSNYSYHQSCNSKRQFERFHIDEYLMSLIDSYESHFRTILETISLNRNEYADYLRKINGIKSSATENYCKSFGFTLKKFLRYEERLFNKYKLPKPQTDVFVKCILTYTSPKGRNHYSKEYCYNYIELKDLFDRTIELKTQRQTRQYWIKMERAKLTDSLRYDILKRDNFACQICGSTANDGVKLHVDHIIPVSKGGETIKSNLRTLCDRCNIGKSDKI